MTTYMMLDLEHRLFIIFLSFTLSLQVPVLTRIVYPETPLPESQVGSKTPLLCFRTPLFKK